MRSLLLYGSEPSNRPHASAHRTEIDWHLAHQDKSLLEKPFPLPSLRHIAKRMLPGPVRRRLRRLAHRLVTDRTSRPRPTRAYKLPEIGPGPKVMAKLEKQLFASAADRDVAVLEKVVAKKSRRSAGHCRGVLALARWDLASGRPDRAIERMAPLKCPDVCMQEELGLLRADCLLSIGDGPAALAVLAAMVGRGTNRPGLLLRMGHARSLSGEISDHGSGPMIEALNRIYSNAGLSTLRRADVRTPVGIDNLACGVAAVPRTHSSPQVSVVVLQDGRDEWPGSVKSIMEQSWGNLEIVLVTAPASVGDRQELLGSLDLSARLVEASGTPSEMLAAGVRHAGGELIVRHSGSVWSHPQRIESQANAILEGVDAKASVVSRLAVDSTLTPYRSAVIPRPQLVGPDPSSVMVMRGGRSDSEIISDFDTVVSSYSDLTGELESNGSVRCVLQEVPLNLDTGLPVDDRARETS